MTGSEEKPPRDFKEARRTAREAANEAVGDRLDHIVAGADELQQVFEDLKLKDQATYEQLTSIVREAAERNESIGQIVERLKVIGEVGSRLAEKVVGLTPAELLSLLVSEVGES